MNIRNSIWRTCRSRRNRSCGETLTKGGTVPEEGSALEDAAGLSGEILAARSPVYIFQHNQDDPAIATTRNVTQAILYAVSYQDQ